MRKLIITLLMSLLFVMTVSAQEFPCASDVIERSMARFYPNYASDQLKLEDFTQRFVAPNSNARMLNFGCQPVMVIYYVPIVLHVMHVGEPVGTGSNISASDAQKCVDTLNKYFLQAGIQFVPAKTDPNGNSINGIHRVNCFDVANYPTLGIDPSTNPTGAPDTIIRRRALSTLGLSYSFKDYVNVFVVKGVTINQNYANTPSNYELQGIVIDYTSITTTSPAHEMGHYFNLRHVFEGSSGSTCALNNDPTNQGDKLADTPPCLQSDCGSLSCGTYPNPQYSYSSLMSYCPGRYLFSPDAITRIKAALFSEFRWSLVSSPGLIPVDVTTEVSLDSLAFEQDVTQALCDGWLTPKIQIKNYGNTVSSMELEVLFDGVDSVITVNTGFLRGSNNWLTLYSKKFTGSGTHNVEVKVRKVNNVTDYNVMNNNQCTNINVIVQTVVISTNVNPVGAGTMSGAGTFSCNGISDTLKVITNTGYVFQNIKKGSTVVSTNPTYVFPIDLSQGNQAYTANFTVQTFSVSATASPSIGGRVVSGTGTYNYGSNATVVFASKAGYQLTSVTLNGNAIATDSVIQLSALSANAVLVGNFTLKTFTINATVNGVGGSVSGGGQNVTYGTSTTVIATEFSCYTFSGWYENGVLVFSNKTYTFTVTGARNLEARFSQKQFVIAAAVNNSLYGTVSGGDTYGCGLIATVRAHTKPNGKFINWTDNATGLVVSTDSIYSFQASINRILVANFEQVQLAKVSAGSDKTICQGSSVTLTATNSTSYLWNTGQNVPSLTVSPVITTSYIVTGLNGTKDTVVVTVKPLPNVNFTDSIQGSNVQFTAPNGNTTYSWDFGDTQTSQQQNPLHVYTTNGKKYVTLQSTLNGCSNQKTDSVVINNITTGIVNNAAQIDLNIYPNPASNFLKIEIRSLDTYNVEVYNIAGDLLLSNEIVKQLTVDVSLYPKGIYILKLDDGKAIISKQFLVQ